MYDDLPDQSLLGHPNYSVEYQIAFNQAMDRSNKFSMTDVDLKSHESSPWWLLYRDMTNEDSTFSTIMCPTEFENRDTSVILGAICLSQTLFALPVS
jgi:hypothetical protein